VEFNDSRVLDGLCLQLRQADYPRSLNRASINNLFNGLPPWSAQEVEENRIEVNVNELSGTVTAHDGRSQFYNAYLKPGSFFIATTDYGPKHKRANYGKIVTREINKPMKRSIKYTECFRSKFALDVLHGIAPSGWRDPDSWCPHPYGVEDVMVPGNTKLAHIEDMPFTAIYRSFTAPELIKLTRGPHRDPAWNMDLVNACLEWVDENTANLMGTTYPEIWAPEKIAERVKSDGGFYAGDEVPTIDVWDFYFWNDDKKMSGWNRRMILDAWSYPAIDGLATSKFTRPQPVRKKGKPFSKEHDGRFLYNPGIRKWASGLSEIVTWQFADLSAVAPFKYHSVRSLGFLLYAVCHLQNRLYCKFSEAQFEQLMMYFRVKSADDVQRALKVDLVHRGFIDESISFIPAAERYQVRADLIQLGLATNQNIIGRNSASYTAQPNNTQDKRELTATQWMGEANKVTQLVSSALNQSYLYQNVEYREIFRRFTRKNSRDADVRKFQAQCLVQGVPEKVLYNPDCWELEPERVMGAGNKTLEMGIVDRLMAARNLFPPESQNIILHDFVLGVTDDAARADRLVPEQPHISDSIHDAQLAAGTLMQGMPVAVKSGMNHIDYVEALMTSMAMAIQKIEKTDQMGTTEQLLGLQNMADNISQHIAIISQDPNEKQRVKQYGDQLGKLMNLVKAFAQRLQEKMQQQNGQSGVDPEAMARIQAMQMQAEAKAANTRESHAQRTAQRQIQFEMEQQQGQQRTALELQTEAQRAQLALTEQAAKARIDLEKDRVKIQQQKNKPKPKSSA